MPGRSDRPRPDPPDRPADRGSPSGSADDLRRRLASLPASHPSSPWYRDARRPGQMQREGLPGESSGCGPGESRRARSGESREGLSGESGGSGPGESGRARSGESRVNWAGQPAEGRREQDVETGGGEDRGERPGTERAAGRGRRSVSDSGDAEPGGSREMTGEAAAAAARAVRGGQPRGPGKDGQDRRADDALWARAAAQHAAAQARRQARSAGAPYLQPSRREPFRPWFTDSAEEELWLSAEGTGEPWFLSDEP